MGVWPNRHADLSAAVSLVLVESPGVTLIISIISNYGILQASDSNVTRSDSTDVRSDPKVFRLPFADAALGLAGSYRVGRKRIDSWMPECIDKYQMEDDSPSLPGFAEYLRLCLDAEMTDIQRSVPTLIHIAGYLTDESGTHPVLYFVRNAGSINERTGAYEDIAYNFQVSEDFWKRDYQSDLEEGIVDHDRYRTYFNGTPDGRIAFYYFGQIFDGFLRSVWNHPTWNFRAPRSLAELAAIIDLEIRTIGTLYRVSDYPAPLVGGEPQIAEIVPPTEATPLWADLA